jgi:hypothetical protein
LRVALDAITEAESDEALADALEGFVEKTR